MFTKGKTYAPGSVVTWANSGWIAIRETGDLPGDGPLTGWRMIVRGIQGKTGLKGDKGDRGPQGPEGPQGPVRW